MKPDVDLLFRARARLSSERTLVDDLWSEAWGIWFPGGKDDPTLVIVIVEPE